LGNFLLTEVPVSAIEQSNFRIDDNSRPDELFTSLSHQGQLSPIRVRPHPEKLGKYQIIFGNRRLAAARRLGWKSISAQIVEASDTDALIMALAENLDRRDFSDYEKALMIERLHNRTGKTYAEVAELIGRSASFVSQHVAMLHLFPKTIAPEEEMQKILNALTENHARILSGIGDNQERWNMAKLVLSANLGVRELQKYCFQGIKKKNIGRANRSRQEVQEIIQNMIKALNSKDMRPIVNVLCKRHFTLFSSIPPFLMHRNDTVVNYLFGFFHDVDKFVTRVDNSEIVVRGDIAYVILNLASTMSTALKSVRTTTRTTIILQNEDSGWKVDHIHWSFSNPMDVVNFFNSLKPQITR
jgi:ParB/RepB/Spo0J family partition protein